MTRREVFKHQLSRLQAPLLPGVCVCLWCVVFLMYPYERTSVIHFARHCTRAHYQSVHASGQKTVRALGKFEEVLPNYFELSWTNDYLEFRQNS
jgi:hypothetical protein